MVAHAIPSGVVISFGAVVPVDLFFSLSGFLVAQMIVERFGGISSPAAFWAFMANRWLRTVPLYLFALVMYMAALSFSPVQLDLPEIFLRYATFTQYIPKFHALYGDYHFFYISWSLCVEEWFYLLCAVALLLAGKRSARFWIGVAVGLVALSITGRYLIAVAYPDLKQFSFTMSTPTRQDAFVWGIGAYWLARSALSSRMSSLLALAGIILASINFAALAMAPECLYCRVLLPSLAPLSMACLIPSALSWKAPSAVRTGAAWLSKRTYAVYLFHVFVIAATYTPDHHTAFRLLAFMVTTGLLADFLYRYVERPFMRLRPMRAPTIIPVLAARS